jgi:hypothetical protein
MRNIIIGLLLLLSFTASAQWQQTGSKVRYVNGLGIPTKDTAAGVAADSSQILIRPADSSLYIKYKRTWLRVGGGGGSIGGSGTINRVAKFSAGTTIGNSSIQDSASAVAITINPSGNVGVGTTSPRTKLDIAGNLFVNNESNITFPETSTTSYANMFRQSITAALLLGCAYKYSPTAGGFASSFTTTARAAIQVGAGNISFFTDPSSTVTVGTDITPSERLSIINSGNIGVGYTSPSAKLSVNGTTLINTNTDNGVDKLQVSGSMNVSAKATVQTLSVVGATSTTGNIGIFNSSPFYALSVGDGTTTRQVVINGLNSGSSGGSSIAVQANSLTTMMFGNKSNIIGGAYDGQPIFGFGGSTNSLQFYNFNTTVTSAMISSGDRFLIGTTTDNTVDRLQVNGSILSTQYKLSALNTAPATASSSGTLGEIRIDANYIYICTATNTWKRVAIATW